MAWYSQTAVCVTHLICTHTLCKFRHGARHGARLLLVGPVVTQTHLEHAQTIPPAQTQHAASTVSAPIPDTHTHHHMFIPPSGCSPVSHAASAFFVLIGHLPRNAREQRLAAAFARSHILSKALTIQPCSARSIRCNGIAYFLWNTQPMVAPSPCESVRRTTQRPRQL